MPILPFARLPDPAVGRQRDHDRRHPERETLLLAAAGAAQVLGVDHGVTMALAKASILGKVDLWRARDRALHINPRSAAISLACQESTAFRPSQDTWSARPLGR